MSSSTRIRSIEAFPLAAPWEKVFAGGEPVPSILWQPAAHFQVFPRRGQFSTFVRVSTEDGNVGWGEAWGLPDSEVTARLIRQVLAPGLLGRDACAVEEIWELVFTHVASLGHASSFMLEALSGLDLALWDLRSRRAGRAVGQLLLGEKRASVPVYAGSVLLHEREEQTVAQSLELVGRGFQALKVKAGRGVAADLSHLECVRNAVGPGIGLMVDFNCSLDLPTALAFVREAESLDLGWIEEPLPALEIDAMAELRAASTIRIAAGENEFTVAGFDRLMRADAVDLITPNISRVGGMTGLQKIAQRARERGVRVSLHGVGGGLMLAASLQWMSAQEILEPMELNCLPNPLRDFPESRRLEKGGIEVSSGPGWGVEISEGFLEAWHS